MKYIVPDIYGDGIDYYEDLVRKFTDSEYFLLCKKKRQIIYGNLNPKRQQTVQKFIIGELMSLLKNELGIQDYEFISTSSDELVITGSRICPDDITASLKTLNSCGNMLRLKSLFWRLWVTLNFLSKDLKTILSI